MNGMYNTDQAHYHPLVRHKKIECPLCHKRETVMRMSTGDNGTAYHCSNHDYSGIIFYENDTKKDVLERIERLRRKTDK